MKKFYFFILTIITTVFVLGLALLKVNEACDNTLFLIPENMQPYVDYAVDYGAMTLLCMFAFGGLAGRIIKFIIVMFIILAIIVFVIATVAPQWIKSLFDGNNTESVIGLLKFSMKL